MVEEIKVPPNIITNLSEELSREQSTSSPQDANLQQRKVERQQHKSLLRPSHLTDMAPPDSPGLQGRLDKLDAGDDPTSNSSPVGTALLAKKAARGQALQSSLADPSLTSNAGDVEAEEATAPSPPDR